MLRRVDRVRECAEEFPQRQLACLNQVKHRKRPEAHVISNLSDFPFYASKKRDKNGRSKPMGVFYLFSNSSDSCQPRLKTSALSSSQFSAYNLPPVTHSPTLQELPMFRRGLMIVAALFALTLANARAADEENPIVTLVKSKVKDKTKPFGMTVT